MLRSDRVFVLLYVSAAAADTPRLNSEDGGLALP